MFCLYLIGVSRFFTLFTMRPSRSIDIPYIVYWSDGLGGREFDHQSRNGEWGICQRKLPAGPGIWPIFSNNRGLPGRMLAVGIDLYITREERYISCSNGYIYHVHDCQSHSNKNNSNNNNNNKTQMTITIKILITIIKILIIFKYKLDDFGVSSNLIGSLSLANKQLFSTIEVISGP